MTKQTNRPGLTLTELLVVLAILALLASLVVVRLSGILERSQSAVQASSLSDVARTIENYYGIHKSYPDGWDTLVEGSGLYGAGRNSHTLHPNLVSMLNGTPAPLDAATTGASLKAVGINHGTTHVDPTSFPDLSPSDSGSNPDGLHSGHFVGGHGGGSALSVVFLNKSNSAVDYLLKNELNLPSSVVASHQFIVLGFGPRNWAVSEIVQQAPLVESGDPGRYYSRALAVFMLGNSAQEKAQFVGVIGPDGRSIRQSINDFNEQSVRDH
jgi:prepilin-type N-terminal cleavage/methylation domain-containing protein